MSAEDKSRKTEKPTPKRLQQFRQQGMVAHSRELTMMASFWGGLLVALAMLGMSTQAVMGFARQAFEMQGDMPNGMLRAFTYAALPVAGGAILGAILVGAGQLGWPPLFHLPRPAFRFLSAESIRRLIGPKQMVLRALFELLKFGVVALAAAHALRKQYARLGEASSLDAFELGGFVLGAVKEVVVWAGGALAMLGIFHYVRARFEHQAKLRMTREEVKREHREQEGDPQMRGRRRKRMREIVRRQIAAMVPKADVVVVNPTEYAVALRYRTGLDHAPRVLAKGRGLMAQRIRDIARENQIPIVTEPPLARMLYKLTPEGREIPARLYRAVAEVLAYVYRLKARYRAPAPARPALVPGGLR